MRRRVRGLFALFLAAAATPAMAHQFVINGDFETNAGAGQVGYNTTVEGWKVDPGNSPGYTFLFAASTADTIGADGQYGDVKLWGPGNGVDNGLTDSPAGGDFIGQDADFPGHTDAIEQTLKGLVVGQTYTVSFDWAAAQQEPFTGANRSGWTVSLGSDTQSTGVTAIPSEGFSGWMLESFTYTAKASTEVLKFTATGSPAIPPFALLDGVSVTGPVAPEPSTWAMMLLGFTGLGYAGFRSPRRKAAFTA